jgi:ABC-type dipeptide/oligopeptide/nickel transport system permease component
MSPLLKFLVRRLLAIPITLFIITAVLFGIIMMAAPEERATLYLPPRQPSYLTEEQIQELLDRIIRQQGLDDPYPQQYLRWISGVAKGDWGWSPVTNSEVLPALIRRTPITAELTLYSLLAFLPVGLLGGVLAGWREGRALDHQFRAAAFIATSIPPFILGLFLLSIFYVGLGWFSPGRTGIIELSLQSVTTFKNYTGLLTIDGLLNGRLDVTIDALRHLVLPVFTLSLMHWATLGRVTRAAIIEVKDKEYISAAHARGLRPSSIVWRHAFANALLPGLTSSSLSAASLVTGVFVVETIFGIKGLSDLVIGSFRGSPDSALALGFSVYSVFLVIPIMMTLDVLKAVADPRIREEEIG